MRGSCLIVTGPPGAGKTTVARALAERQARGVHLETDSLFHSIVSGYVEPWLRESHDQNGTVMEAAASAAAAFAAGGFQTFADGIVLPWALRYWQGAVAGRSLPLSYVILRPSLEVALRRSGARTGRALGNEAVVRQMYGAFERLGPFEAHVVDASDDAPAATAATIEALTATDALRLGEQP